MCQICGKSMRASMGRQAYECRDCKLVCHKQCHHTTDVYCAQSTVHDMQM